jgi:manganese efflux pump family protein
VLFARPVDSARSANGTYPGLVASTFSNREARATDCTVTSVIAGAPPQSVSRRDRLRVGLERGSTAPPASDLPVDRSHQPERQLSGSSIPQSEIISRLRPRPPGFLTTTSAHETTPRPVHRLRGFDCSREHGCAGLERRERLRVSLLFAFFEGTMPLVGFLIGARVGGAIGASADYIAGTLLIALGAYVLWPRDDTGEQTKATTLAHTHGLALIGLGVGISLDELAIGFSVGLLRLSIVVAAIIIAVQAFVAAQIGVRLGARLGEEIRERAEQLAGVVLMVLGVVFLAARVR